MRNFLSFAVVAVLCNCCASAAENAMPLAGARVVAADEFFGKPSDDMWPGYGILAKSKEDWGLAAARDLTNALSRVLGMPVPLYRESEAPAVGGAVVYLGPTRAASKAGLDAKPMMAGEWRIKCNGKRAFVLARTRMGTAYGVTDFLDRFAGYHFLTMEGDDPCAPNPRASVPPCDFTSRHYFYERHYGIFHPAMRQFYIDGRANAFMRRLGLYMTCEVEGRVRPSLCVGPPIHSYTRYVPPKEYFKKHPEYFSMDEKGRRVDGPLTMLCLSNPEVRKIVREKIMESIAKDREKCPDNPPGIYDFSQTDGIYYICKCPECKKIAAKYGDGSLEFDYVSEVDSGLQLDFVNELARTVRAKYPDVKIRTFAYVNTSKPPKGIVPEPNVIPWFCDWYVKSDHHLPLTHPFNDWCRTQLEKWSKLSPIVEVWDYYLYGGDFPELSVDAIAADMRLFRKLGVSRFYIQHNFKGQCFWELNTYVHSKFFRNPDADLEKVLDEYCMVYGAASGKMREAIDFLRKIIAENPPRSGYLWHQRMLPWRTVENMVKFRGLVREALSVADSRRARMRILLVLTSTDMELVRLYKSVRGTESLREEAKEEWRTAARAIHDGGFFHGADGENLLTRSEDAIARADFKLNRLPDKLKGVPESELIGIEVSRARKWISPKTCKMVDDPDAEWGKAVRAWPEALPRWVQVRDKDLARCDELKLKLEKGDGYRWYRLGVSRLGRGGDVYVPVEMVFPVSDFYVECDGVEDPNWYEFWLSVKYNGKPSAANEEEGLFIDRLLLRRVKKP